MRTIKEINEEIFRLRSFIEHCKNEIRYYIDLEDYDACLSRIIGCMSSKDEIEKLKWIEYADGEVCPICTFPYKKKEGMNWCNCGDKIGKR